jgi:hypothetical protein
MMQSLLVLLGIQEDFARYFKVFLKHLLYNDKDPEVFLEDL